MPLATPSPVHLRTAASLLKAGGVIAYPTEGVWGLGCDPFNERAVRRLLDLKQRPETKGLIIIAASLTQIEGWLGGLTSAQLAACAATWPGPYTWVVPVADAPRWLRGDHESIAVRVSAHPGVQALCRAFGGALVSTSANRSGQPPAPDAFALRRLFGDELDYILPGRLGGDGKPTEIRDAVSGVVLRKR
ncbi:MAG: Sua5/YciO/YrdC/YwlC family protein [Moraxellaceae bacterium]|nr:Sua5/YciO/YrdC/YwlC family protein [Moraxellaceae bacterium]